MLEIADVGRYLFANMAKIDKLQKIYLVLIGPSFSDGKSV